MHGYRIVNEVEQRDAKDWAPISKPQVYYTIHKLMKLKLVEPASDEGEALGPDRQMYRINSQGKNKMNEALSELQWARQRPPPPFLTWMALSSCLTAKKTAEIMDERMKFLKGELAREKRTLQEFGQSSGAMIIAGRLMVSLTIEIFEAELKWLGRAKAELTKLRK